MTRQEADAILQEAFAKFDLGIKLTPDELLAIQAAAYREQLRGTLSQDYLRPHALPKEEPKASAAFGPHGEVRISMRLPMLPDGWPDPEKA